MADSCFGCQRCYYYSASILQELLYFQESSFGLSLKECRDYSQIEEDGEIQPASASAFDSLGNISRGIEIFYYVKGKYYLSVGKMDSAEYLFRKELEEGKDLNNQIAGCKGLQRVFERKEIPDSIAKYANLGYTFNDSAYSLSEMQNIQRLQASYNYNHKKQLAEQKAREAERAWLILALVVSCVIILLLLFSKKYYLFKKAALDYLSSGG